MGSTPPAVWDDQLPQDTLERNEFAHGLRDQVVEFAGSIVAVFGRFLGMTA